MSSKERITWRITLRYGVVLVCIAGLAVASFVLSDELASRQESASATVNVAGRQRMLSQRITLVAKNLTAQERPEEQARLREDLMDAISLMEMSHEGLLRGNADMRLPGRPSSDIQSLFFEPPSDLDRRLRGFLDAARRLASNADPALRAHNLTLLESYLAEPESLLRRLDAVVRQYQWEAKATVANLRTGAQAVLALTLVFLILSAVAVFRPLVRQVRREIESHEETEASLRAAVRQAEYANRTKTEFLANMSHELRTPLNAIIGFSDLLTGQIFGPHSRPEYLEYAKDINDSGRHLLDLINDILDVSRIEIEKLELEERRFNPVQAIDFCIALVRSRADEAGLELRLDIQKPLPHLFADERRIKQILLNLLSNAVKFTPRGGRITLLAASDDRSGMTFRVVDTGIGIAPEDIETALSTFGQVDGTLARKYEGAGLGLPLAKRLAEAHGGSLTLTSKVSVGTTVTVRLPASRLVQFPL